METFIDLANRIGRVSIGCHNDVSNMVTSLTKVQNKGNYPPYNIAQYSETDFEIQVAVSGFNPLTDLTVNIEDGKLVVVGNKQTSNQKDTEFYRYKGIGERDFSLSFQLGNYVIVSSAKCNLGLLSIQLKKDLPEHLKTSNIPIE